MIVILILNFISIALGFIFGWLPVVDKLPTIGGFDIDAALVTGMGQFNNFIQTFWPIQILMQGFLVLMGYYAIKMLVRFFFGSRAPSTHS